MILRGLFWVAVVAVLMPHEPDLGLGRSDAAAAPPARAVADSAASACRGYAPACSAALGLLDSFKIVTAQSLAQVKADIERDERARMSRGIGPSAD